MAFRSRRSWGSRRSWENNFFTFSVLALKSLNAEDVEANVNTLSLVTFTNWAGNSYTRINWCSAKVFNTLISSRTVNIIKAITRNRDTDSVVTSLSTIADDSSALIYKFTATLFLVTCIKFRAWSGDSAAGLIIVIHNIASVNSTRLTITSIVDQISINGYTANSFSCFNEKFGWALFIGEKGEWTIVSQDLWLSFTAEFIEFSEADTSFTSIIFIWTLKICACDGSAFAIITNLIS